MKYCPQEEINKYADNDPAVYEAMSKSSTSFLVSYTINSAHFAYSSRFFLLRLHFVSAFVFLC